MTEVTGKKPLRVMATYKGPGPCYYGLPPLTGYENHDPSRNRCAAFTTRSKLPRKFTTVGPGPAYKIESGFTKHGKDGIPEYTMQGKHYASIQTKTPAPNHYYRERVHPPGEPVYPKYTMRKRTKFKLVRGGPAPNHYIQPPVIGPNLPVKESWPAYTTRKKFEHGSYLYQRMKTPGPAAFHLENLNVVKNQAPVYTARENYPPLKSLVTPSPLHYMREKVKMDKPYPPKYTFGVRHSEFASPFIVDIKDVH